MTLKNVFYFILLAPLALVMSSCSSCMIRKECEKMDWHQHGFDMATKGKRLTGDPVIMRCKAAEFNVPDSIVDVGFKQGMDRYCQPDFVLAKGREGEFFNEDFCSPSQLGILKQKHREGILSYCTPEGGYNAGSSGKKYQGICPTDREKGFLSEFKRGRSKYLKLLIEQNQASFRTNSETLQSLGSRKSALSFRRGVLPGPQTVVEKVYNPATNQYIEKSRVEDPNASLRNSLDSEIRSLENQEMSLNQKQKELTDSTAEMQKELITLE